MNNRLTGVQWRARRRRSVRRWFKRVILTPAPHIGWGSVLALAKGTGLRFGVEIDPARFDGGAYYRRFYAPLISPVTPEAQP